MEFNALKKIDAHLHFNVYNDHIIKKVQENNFQLITVNVDFPEFGSILQQSTVARQLQNKYPTRLAFIAAFGMNNWLQEEWIDKTITHLRYIIYNGAIGVKIWKNIGMSVQDQNGRYISLDDERLTPLFQFLEQNRITVMMHQAEPKNCWLPLNEINMLYERTYFKEHPEHYMYLHPDKPSYDELIRARDRRLSMHPDLVTIQAHLASLEWDVDKIAEFLDLFPNAYVDTAARTNHLMYQTSLNRGKVRDFFLRYQDRILYGTDFFISAEHSLREAKALEEQWNTEWAFFSGASEMVTEEFDGKLKGLDLPVEILNKIYRENALRALPAMRH